MKTKTPDFLRLLAALALGLGGLAGCKVKSVPASQVDEAADRVLAEKLAPSEKTAATTLKPVKDPVQETIYAFLIETRQAYNSRRFDALEQSAAQLRAAKPLFGNGAWKIAHFYGAFSCRAEEPESMWQLHERIHQAWVAAQPESITARVARGLPDRIRMARAGIGLRRQGDQGRLGSIRPAARRRPQGFGRRPLAAAEGPRLVADGVARRARGRLAQGQIRCAGR
jgi:hypothetical protein